MEKKTKVNIKKIEKGLKREWKNLLFNLVFITLSFLFVILFFENIFVATVLMAIVSIIGLIKWNSKMTWIIFFIGAILGPIIEIIAISFGIWIYSITSVFDIPFWLFLAWGNFAAFLYQTAVELKRLGVKK